MSNGWPAMKFVAVDEKNSWPSDGARNPVLTAPRSANLAHRLEARRDLSRRRRAEVAVVLEPAGDADEKLLT